MGDLSVNVILFKERIMFKSHLVKSDRRVLRINRLDIYAEPVLSLDYSATVSAAKLPRTLLILGFYGINLNSYFTLQSCSSDI